MANQLMNELTHFTNKYMELCDESCKTIGEFRKLIFDHLDPSEKDVVDLDNTPIYLDEIDHHLHPQIQEILTNNFGIKQQQHQVFTEITEIIYKLAKHFTQIEIQKYFIENKMPIYLIPNIIQDKKDKKDKKENDFMWGEDKQKYQLAIIITPNPKYLIETISKYGFDSLDETETYLNQSGFTIENNMLYAS
jgi:hypothetical protein